MERLRVFPLISLLALTVFVLAACDPEAESRPQRDTEVALEDALAALVRPGQVFYAEYDYPPEGDQAISFRLWYSGEQHLARLEFVDTGDVGTVRIFTAERIVSHDFREGRTDIDDRLRLPAGVRGAAALAVEHLRPWLAPDATLNIRSEQRDGRATIHATGRRVLTEGTSDEPAGTEFTFESWLDAASLLPLHARVTVALPDSEDGGAMDITYRKAEFVAADSLPADHFDADELAAMEVTLDEAVDLAANQPFATFWLGEQIAVPWDAPDGRHHDAIALTRVDTPGTPRGRDGVVWLDYSAPPSFFGGLLTLVQGPEATFEAIRADELAAMESAGNVNDLGALAGYTYARWAPSGGCSFAEAQTEARCRFHADPAYGVVVERDGTRIHLSVVAMMSGADREGSNVNPFNDPAVLERLARNLRVMGE